MTESKRTLESEAAKQAEICERLGEANDKLSQRALNLAEEAEQGKQAVQMRLEKEVKELKTQLKETENEMDDVLGRFVIVLSNLVKEPGIEADC